MAQSSLELATQQDGVEVFGIKYYAMGLVVGDQPRK